MVKMAKEQSNRSHVILFSFPLPVSSLYELCAHTIVHRTTVYGINRLPLPDSVKANLKSYALTNNYSSLRQPGSSSSQYKSIKIKKHKHRFSASGSSSSSGIPPDASSVNCGVTRKSCVVS